MFRRAARSTSDKLGTGKARPSAWAVLGLTLLVLVLHLAFIAHLTGALEWQSALPLAFRVKRVETRWTDPLPPPLAQVAQVKPSQPRTRIATEVKSAPEPEPPKATQAKAKPKEALDISADGDSNPQTPPVKQNEPSPISEKQAIAWQEEQNHRTPDPAENSTFISPAEPSPEPAPTQPDEQFVEPKRPFTPELLPTPNPETLQENLPDQTTAATSAATVVPSTETQNMRLEQAFPATAFMPSIPMGALPPSVLLSYNLTGQSKGMNYFATGELQWQHNENAYALGLSVRAFLIGSRQWKSQGAISPLGLAPKRFSDIGRNERAAHFDRVNNKVVFSNNAPTVALEPGAQDQISLYVQLAAAMAANSAKFQPGTRLQIQTATIKDASPWMLTLDKSETLVLEGEELETTKWVCQPKNRFDATVTFWVSPKHAWMPVRIRITQVNGNFIDLALKAHQALPSLPPE